MSRIEIILIVLLAIILVAYLSFVAYIIYKIRYERKEQKSADPSSLSHLSSSVDLNSPYQTDFFNKSAEHAEKVLFGKQFIQEYGEPGYYGNKLLDVIHKLNDETKRSVIIAIKYMCIEPRACRNNERTFRAMAEQEKVPLWFLILREAVKKVVPEFTEEKITVQSDNVVPLYQKTG